MHKLLFFGSNVAHVADEFEIHTTDKNVILSSMSRLILLVQIIL